MKKYYLILVISTLVFIVGITTTLRSSTYGVEIAIIINNDNPINSMTASEVKLYYMRKLKKRWPEINKNILPADRKKKCPEQETFYAKVLGLSEQDVEQYFINRQMQNAEKPQDKFNLEVDLIEFVASEPGAIGYINAKSITPEVRAKVKVVLEVQ